MTASVPISVVDAFTATAFRGNPAGVCVVDEPAEEAWMQSVAAEMKHAETAFVVQAGDASRWGLRWFTPTVEIDLCGHATLAAAHVLWETGRAARTEPLRFHTLSGELGARLDGELIELDFPAVPLTVTSPPFGLGAAIGCEPVDSGTDGRSWLVEVGSAADVRALEPDIGAVAGLVDHLLVVTARGDGDRDVVSRVFAPNVGVDEDPVTGSAHCLLGPWWAERLGRDVLRCEQASARGGELRVTVDGERVRLGGHAVTVLAGELLV